MDIKKANQILKEIFGYTEFRFMQEKIIAKILEKKDTLAIMPTGSGKSLCYQIPGLLFQGLTIVVSPLISLMQDQINQLEELGINAAILNSTISYSQYNKNIEKIKNNQAKFLYIAPESLLKDKIINLLKTVKVDCLTIDEAHCISDWGHDFRPEYRMLIDVRKNFKEAVVLALTATATPRVQEDIKQSLNFNNSNTFVSSFNRKNLILQVKNKQNTFNQLIHFLDKFKNQSGIIYCFSRDQVENISTKLKNKGFSVKPYHAGLSDKERKENQDLFIKDDVQIIVATIAFGMGINKPNVRFVVHYDLPKNIESYYQEIGRAGRDGLESTCLLFFSYGDINKIKYFINQKKEKEKLIANNQLNSLLEFATSIDCRRLPLLSYFGENDTIKNCGMCDNCLSTSKNKQNLTIEAQKLLSCVKRTGEIYGLVYVINVLRGSKSQKIINAGHDNLSTYGIGKDLTKKEWIQIAQQLLNQNFLEKDDKYGSLKFTKKAYKICRGEIEFHSILIREEKLEKKSENKLKTSDQKNNDYDLKLFELLRRKRKELADEKGVPPYIIFSDRSLIDMATLLPKTYAEMLEVSGVGEFKLRKYGDIFLKIIREYC